MNPFESEIEQQLRALRPHSPSPGLEERIGAALASRTLTVAERHPAAAVIRRGPVTRAAWWRGIGWAFAGALTAAAVIAGIETFRPAEKAAAPSAPAFAAETLEHVDASAEIVAADDEGLTLTDDAEPVRRIRYTSYERHVWTNPATGMLVEYTVPREDIRLTPIAFQ